MQSRVLAFVLAGGRGTRLYPLTKERAKPAVPFGGKYRIVDFVLSNLINSGIYSIYVLIQFKSQSLLQHLRDGWQFSGILKDQFIIPVPAQMRTPGETWYRGTADAIYQNLNLIEQSRPDVVAIFGADHIYRMNIHAMLEYHQRKEAEVTVAAIPVERDWAAEFGVIETDDDGRIIGFHEKNPDAPAHPGQPRARLRLDGQLHLLDARAAAGTARRRRERAERARFRQGHPAVAWSGASAMYAYDFQTNRIPGDPPEVEPYWRDVGTIDAYYEATMDLRVRHSRAEPLQPAVAAADRQLLGPARQVHLRRRGPPRRGHRLDRLRRLHPVRRHGAPLGARPRTCASTPAPWWRIRIVFDNCDIGRRCKIRRAILDKNVKIPADTVIGYDLEQDRQRYHVTESGIVVVEGRRSPVPISIVLV